MTCPKCGAENTAEARFCRICGVQLGAEGFHEAPTRNFEEGRTPAPEVSPFATYGADGSAILPPRDPRMYVPPSVVQQPGAMVGYQPGTAPAGPIPTNPLQTGPVRKSYMGRILLTVAGIAVFVLVAMIGLGIWVARNVTPVVTDDGKGGIDVSLPGGGGPIVSVNEGSSPDSLKGPIADWYYDGAEIETSVNSSVGGVTGAVLEMTTDDDVDTVAEFYREKFADIESKTEIRDPDSISFSGGNTHVEIESPRGPDGPTAITVVMGNVGGMPGGGPIPPIPAVPEIAPPAVPEPPAKSDGKARPDAKAPKAEATAPPAKPARP